MIRVRVLGAAFIVLGAAELIWAAAVLMVALGLGYMDVAYGSEAGGEWLAYAVLAALNGTAAAVHLYAGIRVFKGQALGWAIAGVIACVPELVLALYCAPITMFVLLYAVVVLCDSSVRDALES